MFNSTRFVPDKHNILLPTQSSIGSVCEGTFFPSLLKEMSTVVGSFNDRARRLLELHLSSGVRKRILCFKDKMKGDHAALVQEGKDLVTYAIINAIAMHKILKKYDKIHYSKQGQAFKSQAHSLHVEILQSPWLCELMAFHINLVSRLLQYSPKLRCNALDACLHPFFYELCDPNARLPNGRTTPPIFNIKHQELKGAPKELLTKLVPEHARKQCPIISI